MQYCLLVNILIYLLGLHQNIKNESHGQLLPDLLLLLRVLRLNFLTRFYSPLPSHTMGSYLNFKNFADTSQPESSGGKPMNIDNFSLARQSSIYSFTFDELQSTCGLGKDFGSMNMDDLLKNIWTAEESQALSSSVAGGNVSVPVGNLQRQGSLTLPRTISQKTVDEVWKDFQKESVNANDGSAPGASNFGQRQSTLGEMTLEEFLVRAGAVREDMQPTRYSKDVTFTSGFTQPSSNNSSLTIAFQQATQNPQQLSNQIAGNNIFNVVTTTSSQQKPQQAQPLFPKQTTVAFASPMQLGNTAQLASPGTRAPIVGMSNPSVNTTIIQGSIMQGGVMDMAGLHNGVTSVKGGSPGNLDPPSLSPSPYACGEGGRGRRSCTSFEKVVERRRKRMIKNRESAARSRDRKQAYTLELETEVAKLKEIKQELQKKQAEFIEKQKNQLLEKMNMPWENKLICLRRTVTGPW
ncbi:ABSCISIC ACID-INSENSITIVE 5-like protein 4 [Nicotiana tabacum]|uniref:ABSCISIC ACID-INSENSITIVE 5-like protein 4 n=1 Tax=Nicotiana tabacum TaxID=4097 RepID=Q94IB2_TOBAC|nr:ABSCISIC ACID-INSENSITIVE 5-like protein 4 [Nicotiana tabacum]BAB61098.1 phi-2 [Nicotiana tabacum]